MSMSSSSLSSVSITSLHPSQEPEAGARCPHPAWSHYLPDTAYSDTGPEVASIAAAAAFIQRQGLAANREAILEKRFFTVNIEQLVQDSQLAREWPQLGEQLEERAEHVAGILGLAMHQLLTREAAAETAEMLPVVRARLDNCGNLIHLKELKSHYFQRLVAVQGTVVRVSPMRVHNTWLAWQCATCRAEFVVHQPEGKFRAPSRCPQGCRNQRNYVPLRASKATVCVDRQLVRLQEVEDEEGGRVPRTVDCELLADLCDTCLPGDIVTVTGVVKVSSGEEARAGAGKRQQSQYLLYISGLGVTNTRSSAASQRMAGTQGIVFTYSDLALVQDIHSYGGRVFKLLVSSLCPAIFGQSLVKAGLLLGLFGGTVKGANTALPVRGDPHILIVGDPGTSSVFVKQILSHLHSSSSGLGKSQMLTAACNVAPRGVFVTGNTTSATGLTVSLAR